MLVFWSHSSGQQSWHFVDGSACRWRKRKPKPDVDLKYTNISNNHHELSDISPASMLPRLQSASPSLIRTNTHHPPLSLSAASRCSTDVPPSSPPTLQQSQDLPETDNNVSESAESPTGQPQMWWGWYQSNYDRGKRGEEERLRINHNGNSRSNSSPVLSGKDWFCCISGRVLAPDTVHHSAIIHLVSRARLSYPKREKESGEGCIIQLYYWNAHCLAVGHRVNPHYKTN